MGVNAPGRPKLPAITKGDAVAALTTGIANVPDGMASAVLAGVNPVHGIYTLIVGTPLAAAAMSTQLMMFNTTSAMTLVSVDGLGDLTEKDRIAALLVIALVAGLFQVLMGALKLGTLTKFVSNAVMTGFLTGIAVRIVLGQLWDMTGYTDELGGPLLDRTARLFGNLGAIDPWTAAIGIGSLVTMLALGRTRLGDFNLLVALILAGVVAKVAQPESVALVSSLGEIPRSLPEFALPRLDLIPDMLLPGVAVALVGLLQAAGVAQAYPNPDGSATKDSRDFIAQGIGNSAGSLFSSMAGGGSLSGTALSVSAGARSRMAGILQAVVVAVLVLVFGGLLGMVPFAALAALLVYAGALSIKPAKVMAVARTSTSSLLAMVVTFLATLVVPLQQAVLFGVILSTVLFVWRASVDVRLTEVSADGGPMVTRPVPAQLRANDVTAIHVTGNMFFAGARTFGDLLPRARGVERPVVVLGLLGEQDVGSTFFAELKAYANEVREAGGRLMLSGVEPPVMARLQRTGMLEFIGPENVFPATGTVGESAAAAARAGREWLGGLPPAPAGSAVAGSAGISAPAPVPASMREPRPGDAAAKPAAASGGRGLLLQDAALALSAGAAFIAWHGWPAVGWQAVSGALLAMVAAAWFALTRSADARQAPVRAMASGTALLSALLVLSVGWQGALEADVARWIAGVGIAATGLLGLVAAGGDRGAGNGWIAAAVANAATVGVGVALVLFSRGVDVPYLPVAWAVGAVVAAVGVAAFARQSGTD